MNLLLQQTLQLGRLLSPDIFKVGTKLEGLDPFVEAENECEYCTDDDEPGVSCYDGVIPELVIPSAPFRPAGSKRGGG